MTKAAKGARDFFDIANREQPRSDFNFKYNGAALSTNSTQLQPNVRPEELDAYLPREETFNLRLESNPGFRTTIGANHSFKIINLTLSGSAVGLHLQKAEVTRLNVGGDNQRLTLSECTIFELHLNNCTEVNIEGCKIGRLIIANGAKLGDISIGKDTRICEFQIAEKFSLRDLSLGKVHFSSTHERKLESSNIGKVRLPRLDRQSFSNLLTWAETAKNSEVAHVARSAELAIELTQSRGLESVVLWLWKLFGNFGLSPGRSLTILVLGMLLYGGLLYCQGSALGYEPLEGWQQALKGDEPKIEVKRAIVGALQNTFSPFSVFSPRKLIVPANAIGAIGQFIQAINTIVMALLTGFALRRRFRMP